MKYLILFAAFLFATPAFAQPPVQCEIFEVSQVLLVHDATGTVELCGAIRLCVTEGSASARITTCDYLMPVEPPCESDGTCGGDPDVPICDEDDPSTGPCLPGEE